MTRDELMSMLEAYGKWAHSEHDVLHGIRSRFPEDGSTDKANRWVGFCQGILVERQVFDLDEVKEHSKTRQVPEAPPQNGVILRVNGRLVYQGPESALPDVWGDLVNSLTPYSREPTEVENLNAQPLVSLDGGKTYQPAPEGVRAIYPVTADDLPGGDCGGELHVNMTHEGIIMDVWTAEPGEDRNLATRSQTVDELVSELMEDDS